MQDCKVVIPMETTFSLSLIYCECVCVYFRGLTKERILSLSILLNVVKIISYSKLNGE